MKIKMVDSVSVPAWVNEAFFYKLCKSIISDKDFKILNFSITGSTKTGVGHFASPICRARVTISSKHTEKNEFSFVLKFPSISRPINEDVAFENEIRFYSSTLPDMHRLLEHSGEKARLGPNVIQYATETNAVIVLEDLAEQSFYEPLSPLNLDVTVSAIFKLAKWHAASIFMAKENKDLIYNVGLFNKKYSDTMAFLDENFRYFVKEINGWDGYGLYAKKFNQLLGTFHSRGQAIFTPTSDGLNVLNHGDINLKNLLIQKDTDKFDILFVDYQFSVWATPAIDLFYLLYLVASADVRTLYKTELITFYYNELVNSLKKMGYLAVPPSLLELQLGLLQNGFLEVIIATCILPFSNAAYRKNCDDSDVNELRKTVYTNEEYRSVVKSQLPYYLSKGFLN